MISNTQAGYVRKRLTALNLKDMNAYFRSEKWEELVRRYNLANMRKRCAVCASKDAYPRHRTFKRMGNEKLTDIVCLCEEHYKEILRHPKLDLYNGHKILRQKYVYPKSVEISIHST